MDTTEWTIVHVERPWKGRTEPMKLILEDAGVPYAVRCEELGPTIAFDMWRGSEAAIAVDSTPFPDSRFPPPNCPAVACKSLMSKGDSVHSDP